MAEKVYVGKGRVKQFPNGGSVINFGIDVSKLPPPNEKGFINLTITEMRQADQWGNTHTVYINDFVPGNPS